MGRVPGRDHRRIRRLILVALTRLSGVLAVVHLRFVPAIEECRRIKGMVVDQLTVIIQGLALLVAFVHLVVVMQGDDGQADGDTG